MSHDTQVGLVLFAVSPDVSQHAAWHRDNSPPVLPQWARGHEGASGLLLVRRYVLRQAVLRGHSVLEETQEDAPDILPQHLFITLTAQAVDDQREEGIVLLTRESAWSAAPWLTQVTHRAWCEPECDKFREAVRTQVSSLTCSVLRVSRGLSWASSWSGFIILSVLTNQPCSCNGALCAIFSLCSQSNVPLYCAPQPQLNLFLFRL